MATPANNPEAASTPSPVELDLAFAALATYAEGSSRGALLAIDAAAVRALSDERARREIEKRLLDALGSAMPVPGREYLCRKLVLVGGRSSVRALAALLSDPELGHAARAALEANPDPEAVAAMRGALKRLTRLPRIGVVLSLGARRDAASVGVLRGYLTHDDAPLAAAAADALGRIGDPKAGRALGAFLREASPARKPGVADACLACAERLAASGRTAQARALREQVAAQALSPFVRQAALHSA